MSFLRAKVATQLILLLRFFSLPLLRTIPPLFLTRLSYRHMRNAISPYQAAHYPILDLWVRIVNSDTALGC
jgi:hypothetical protein